VQVFKVVRISAFGAPACGHYTCFWCKCLRFSVQVLLVHLLVDITLVFGASVFEVVRTSAFGWTCLWTLHLCLVQVLKVVRTSAFGCTCLWTLHLCLVQVLKVIHTSAFGAPDYGH
jgi:hypothetical protein